MPVNIQDLIKAVTTASGSAGGFLPSPKAETFIDIVRERVMARNLFRVVKMESSTLAIPKITTGAKVYYQSSEASEGQETSLVSSTITLTAKKLMAWMEISSETFEDGVGNMGEMIMEQFARKIGDAEEETILVGDVDYPRTTTTESSATSTRWFSKDHKLAFDGLETIGIESGTRLVADGSDMSTTIAREAIYRMGLYGKRSKDLVLFLNPWSANQLLTDSNIVTLDKYGPTKATILTGEVGKLFGQIRVFDTDYVNDSKGVMVNKDNVIIGDKRKIKFEKDRIVKNDSDLWAVSSRICMEVENDSGVVAITRLSSPTAS